MRFFFYGKRMGMYFLLVGSVLLSFVIVGSVFIFMSLLVAIFILVLRSNYVFPLSN